MIDKEKILEDLKNKYAKTSQLSERTIGETLETLMFTADAETTEADFVLKIDPIFASMAGNVRKDVSESVKKFKETFPIETPKPQPEATEKEAKPEEVDKTVREFMDKLAQMEQKLADLDRSREAEKQKVESVQKMLDVYPRQVVNTALDGFDFGQDDAGDKFVAKVGRVASNFGIQPQRGTNESEKPNFDALRKELTDLETN